MNSKLLTYSVSSDSMQIPKYGGPPFMIKGGSIKISPYLTGNLVIFLQLFNLLLSHLSHFSSTNLILLIMALKNTDPHLVPLKTEVKLSLCLIKH